MLRKHTFNEERYFNQAVAVIATHAEDRWRAEPYEPPLRLPAGLGGFRRLPALGGQGYASRQPGALHASVWRYRHTQVGQAG